MIAILNISKFLFIIALIILFNACSPKIIKQISWQSIPVKVDGNASEWESMKYFCTKNKLTYTVSNDSNNLYICITTLDRTTQIKILRAGMELSIDTTGKNRSQLVISYPLAQNKGDRKAEQRQEINNQGESGSISMMKKKLSPEQSTMNLFGFKHTINGVSPINIKNGINVSMGIDSSQVLTYEASIPLRTFYKASLEPNDTNRVFGFNIKVNGVQLSQNDEGGHIGRGGMSKGGQGGSGRRGGGGRGMGGNGNDRGALAESYTCEMLFHLNFVKVKKGLN